MCVYVCERDAKDRRERRKGEERGGVVGPSFMLNKAMMGGSPGDDIPGRNRHAFLCSERIPQEGREGKMESQQSSL